jgi:tetratricopeptide (TPR) repeat protein
MASFVRFTILFTLIALCGGVGSAQQKDADIKLRLAQSYERGGSYETATALYEELYAKDSLNYVVFDALRRMYLQLKKYDHAIKMVQARLRKIPNDPITLMQLGTIYLRASKEKEAFDAWDKAIAVGPPSETTYRIVGDAMIENRVFDRAIALYKRARAELSNQGLFTMDIAYLYSIVLNYTEATREYLRLVRDVPQQLPYVQSRIASYTGRTDGLTAATLAVEQATQSEPDNIIFQRLLSWLYIEGKRYDNAYTVYRSLDEKTKASGREIYNFAELALKEKAYEVASKAFGEVIAKYQTLNVLPEAKFGYARTMEEASAERDTLNLFGKANPFSQNEKPATESQPTFTGAVAAYKRIVTEYPNTEIAARALLRIATLMVDRFFNLDESRNTLETINRKYTSFVPVLLEAKLLLGDVDVALGNLDKAEASYSSLTTYRYGSPEYQERAAFRLAELNYFRGKFQDALKKLQELTKNATSNITNDALSLLIFIQENMQPKEDALKEYAKAELLERQRKLSEALTAFDAIANTYKDTPLGDEALMSSGDVLIHMNRYTDAISSYEQLVKDFPESILLDRALMKLGEVYEFGLVDKPKAIESYKTVLEKYPNSIFVSEARKHIRELRGETP